MFKWLFTPKQESSREIAKRRLNASMPLPFERVSMDPKLSEQFKKELAELLSRYFSFPCNPNEIKFEVVAGDDGKGENVLRTDSPIQNTRRRRR